MSTEIMKIITWNIAGRSEPWRWLTESDADIALIQEARKPPPSLAKRIGTVPAPWVTEGAGVNRKWRSAVVRISDQVAVEWLEPKSLADANPGDFALSRIGMIDAAHVTPKSGDSVIVASNVCPVGTYPL